MDCRADAKRAADFPVQRKTTGASVHLENLTLGYDGVPAAHLNFDVDPGETRAGEHRRDPRLRTSPLDEADRAGEVAGRHRISTTSSGRSGWITGGPPTAFRLEFACRTPPTATTRRGT